MRALFYGWLLCVLWVTVLRVMVARGVALRVGLPLGARRRGLAVLVVLAVRARRRRVRGRPLGPAGPSADGGRVAGGGGRPRQAAKRAASVLALAAASSWALALEASESSTRSAMAGLVRAMVSSGTTNSTSRESASASVFSR